MGSGEAAPAHTIAEVGEADLADLLGLVRAYCDFYRCSPSDAALLDLSRALLENPRLEGVQLIARDGAARAVGFATVFWSWDTTEASRIGIMNDLYVAPAARASGLADRLIAAALGLCEARGAVRLEWQTGAREQPSTGGLRPRRRGARAVCHLHEGGHARDRATERLARASRTGDDAGSELEPLPRPLAAAQPRRARISLRRGDRCVGVGCGAVAGGAAVVGAGARASRRSASSAVRSPHATRWLRCAARWRRAAPS